MRPGVSAGQSLAHLDDVVIPPERLERCLDLAESGDLVVLAREAGTQLERALAWDGVRSAVASLLQGGELRVGTVRLPGPLSPDEASRLADVLAKAVAAEVLPVRPSQPVGGPERLAAHADLHRRLLSLFTERFRQQMSAEEGRNGQPA